MAMLLHIKLTCLRTAIEHTEGAIGFFSEDKCTICSQSFRCEHFLQAVSAVVLVAAQGVIMIMPLMFCYKF